MSKFIRNPVATGVLTLSLSPVASFAQIEEIVVTAERREVSAQDAPVAVTALSPQDLEQKQIRNIRDLQHQIPNLSLSNNVGTASGARIFLRGVGEDESRAPADPAIGVYVDGVYLGRQTGAMLDLVDLERVEVLRGPQGTLYGRNSNGGAVKLVSVKPKLNEEHLGVKLTVGNYGRFDARMTGNLGLTDSAAVRATVLSKRRGGFHDLVPDGELLVQTREVGAVDMLGLRGAVLQQFGDGWEAVASIDYIDDASDPAPSSLAPGFDDDDNLFTIDSGPRAACSRPPGEAQYRLLTTGCFGDHASDVEQLGVALNVQGELGGGYSVSSLTGYRSLEDNLATRISIPYFQQTDQEQFSQEFSLASNYEGPFNFVAGLYYFHEDLDLDFVFFNNYTIDLKVKSWAMFGQGTYEIIDDLSFTAGLRYTKEDKELDAANLGLTGMRTESLARAEERDFDAVNFKAGLDYRFNDDLMAYVSYATGFKSGGWSPDCGASAVGNLNTCFRPVGKEEVDTIEVGLRSDWLDGRLRFNATYFFNMYDDLQIGASVPNPTGSNPFTRVNVDEVEIHGMEVEFVFQPTEALELNGNIGWLDGEYKSVTAMQADILTFNGASIACPPGTDTDEEKIACNLGLEIKNAPEFNLGAGAVLRFPVMSNELSLGAHVSYEDKTWNLVANNPITARTDPGVLWNARMAYGDPNGKWEVALWGKNLSDKEYARASISNMTQYAAAPRAYGVDLRYRFF